MDQLVIVCVCVDQLVVCVCVDQLVVCVCGPVSCVCGPVSCVYGGIIHYFIGTVAMTCSFIYTYKYIVLL